MHWYSNIMISQLERRNIPLFQTQYFVERVITDKQQQKNMYKKIQQNDTVALWCYNNRVHRLSSRSGRGQECPDLIATHCHSTGRAGTLKLLPSKRSAAVSFVWIFFGNICLSAITLCLKYCVWNKEIFFHSSWNTNGNLYQCKWKLPERYIGSKNNLA